MSATLSLVRPPNTCDFAHLVPLLRYTARCFLANAFSSVASYSIASGQLTLHHKFPNTSEVKAVVDVRLLLERLTAEQTSVGEWVNIIGYIACAPSQSFAKQSDKRKRGAPTVHVQALMLWSSGPLNISRYEACLADVAHSDEPTARREEPEAT